MGRNNGKFYDAQLMRDYCVYMKSELKKYNGLAEVVHGKDNSFHDGELFIGEAARSLKKFVQSGTGDALKSVKSMHEQMADTQDMVMSLFERIVDPAANARIEYDTLERINNDFKDLYSRLEENARGTERIVNSLNSEFGSYAYFPQPNSQRALSSFEFICGGHNSEAGYFKSCQNKLIEFDSVVLGQIKGKDTIDRTNRLNQGMKNASGSINSDTSVNSNLKTEMVTKIGDALSEMNAFLSLNGVFGGKKGSLGTDPFDDKGMYGGNQKGLNGGEVKKFLWFNYVEGEDKELFKFIRKHPGYEKYSEMQMHEMFEDIDDHACTYVAASNSIFNEYKGREKEFEKTFGFPMIGKNGDLNYNMLLLDYYLETKDKVYLEEPEGLELFVDCQGNYYYTDPWAYIDKYGENPVAKQPEFFDESPVMNPNFYDNIKEEFVQYEKEGKNVVEYDGFINCFDSAVPNRLSHYCHEKGIEVNVVNMGEKLSNSDIQNAIDEGKTVVFGAYNFDLENEDGTIYKDSVAGHEMTITGIASDGRYIVSTWGEKAYYNPEENEDCEARFYAIDYDN